MGGDLASTTISAGSISDLTGMDGLVVGGGRGTIIPFAGDGASGTGRMVSMEEARDLVTTSICMLIITSIVEDRAFADKVNFGRRGRTERFGVVEDSAVQEVLHLRIGGEMFFSVMIGGNGKTGQVARMSDQWSSGWNTSGKCRYYGCNDPRRLMKALKRSVAS